MYIMCWNPLWFTLMVDGKKFLLFFHNLTFGLCLRLTGKLLPRADPSLIENCRGRLRKLWLSGAWLTDESFANLDQLADTLQLLSISFGESLGEHGLRSIANLTNLETFILYAIEKTPWSAFVSAFSDPSRQLNKLWQLELRWCYSISDVSLVAMGRACSNLNTLKLSHYPEL